MSVTAQVTRRIPADRDEVWETLTSRDGMKEYMMGADVSTDWQPGHPITMEGEMGGRPFRDTGEVRSFDPGRSLAYTHRSGVGGKTHLVTVEVEPAGDRVTAVTVTQSNADGTVTPADRQHRGDYEQTWASMLEGLERAVKN
jgi:uncharacterized protein YndB with AHSA1/START domain